MGDPILISLDVFNNTLTTCKGHSCSAIAEIENLKNDRPSDLRFNLCRQRSLLKCHVQHFLKLWTIEQKGV